MLSEPRESTVDILDEKITVDWLIYKSYEFNRDRSPHVRPFRWRRLYLNQKIYEKIYQKRNSDVT